MAVTTVKPVGKHSVVWNHMERKLMGQFNTE